jgi:hypothetical protein
MSTVERYSGKATKDAWYLSKVPEVYTQDGNTIIRYYIWRMKDGRREIQYIPDPKNCTIEYAMDTTPELFITKILVDGIEIFPKNKLK